MHALVHTHTQTEQLITATTKNDLVCFVNGGKTNKQKTCIVLPFQVFCLLYMLVQAKCHWNKNAFRKNSCVIPKKKKQKEIRLCFARVARGSIELRIVWENACKSLSLKIENGRCTHAYERHPRLRNAQIGSTCTTLLFSPPSHFGKVNRKQMQMQTKSNKQTISYPYQNLKKNQKMNSQTYQLKHTHKQKSTRQSRMRLSDFRLFFLTICRCIH